MSSPFSLRPVATADEAATARALVREYVDTLGEAAEYVGLDEELAALTIRYGPPGGVFLLAYHEGDLAGCGALRSFDAESAELRRLYVRPAYRGRHLGRRLVEALVDEARRLGYRRVLLDTLTHLTAARALYASMGFREITPYYHSPIPGTHYLALPLAPQAG